MHKMWANHCCSKGLQTERAVHGVNHVWKSISYLLHWPRKTLVYAQVWTCSPVSIILSVDGGGRCRPDQILVPHFTTSVKDQRVHGIAVHLIGLLRHGAINRMRLITMTDYRPSGANHITESVYRLINEKEQSERTFPLHLFLQLDNSWRENKKNISWLIWNFCSYGMSFKQSRSDFTDRSHA